MRTVDFVRSLDFFGFTPNFRISGRDELKSFMGGFFTLIFLILSITYLIYSVLNYISNINRIISSRQNYKNSDNYWFSPIDIYYGLGITSDNQTYLNLTNHPYFEISAEYLFENKIHRHENSSLLSFVPCDTKYFISENDFNLLSESNKIGIKNTLSSYNCLDFKKNIFLTPEFFSQDNYILQLSINLKPNINLTETMNYMTQIKASLSLIYKDYLVNSENREKPYTQQIGEFTNLISFYFTKTLELKINPSNIVDDTNPFGQGDFIPIEIPQYSSQADQSIMMSQRIADYFRYLSNRELGIYSNRNLITIRISLSNRFVSTLRSYRKANDFIAGLTSLISNGFIIFAIFIQKLNKIKGINNMVKSSFGLNETSNLLLFKERFKSLYDNFIQNKGDKRGSNRKLRSIINKFSSGRSLRTKQKSCKFSEGIIIKSSESNLMRTYSNIEKNIEEFVKIEMKVSFIDYLRVKYLCSKKNDSKLLENAIARIEQMLDINTYLKFKIEMKMIKEVILDQYQKKAFDSMSTILNFNRLIEEEWQEENSFRDLLKTEFNELNFPLGVIFRRKNEIDQKLINLLQKLNKN